MDIVIRRAEPGDYEAVHQIISGPRATFGTLQVPYPSVESWRKRLAEPPEGFILLLACAGGEPIGMAGIETHPNSPRRRHAASLGMTVRDDWQGKGIGTALMQAAVELCDRWLQIRRMELEVYADNASAVHLYEKFGFQIEGTLREFAFRDGTYIDAYVMGRLRPSSE